MSEKVNVADIRHYTDMDTIIDCLLGFGARRMYLVSLARMSTTDYTVSAASWRENYVFKRLLYLIMSEELR